MALPLSPAAATLAVLWGGLALGAALGALAQATRFCTMGALSDWFGFGSPARLMMWVLAMAVAAALTMGLVGGAGLDATRSVAWSSRFLWLSYLVGFLPEHPETLEAARMGSAIAALVRGEFRVESFRDAADLGSHLLGGVLMGFGGIAAVGCSIGQGISGLSMLSAGACLAVAGIVAGAWDTLRWQMWRLERAAD